MVDAATQQALHQIFDRLGNIDGQMKGINSRLDAGGKRHEEFSQQLADLDAKVDQLPALKETVDKMQPIAENWKRAQWVGSGIVLAVGSICGFLGMFWTDIRAAITLAFGGKG